MLSRPPSSLACTAYLKCLHHIHALANPRNSTRVHKYQSNEHARTHAQTHTHTLKIKVLIRAETKLCLDYICSSVVDVVLTPMHFVWASRLVLITTVILIWGFCGKVGALVQYVVRRPMFKAA